MTKQEQILLIKKENLKTILSHCIKQAYNEGYRDAEHHINRGQKDITYIFECIFGHVNKF